MKHTFATLIITVGFVITVDTVWNFVFAITWNAAARLLFKNRERALAAYTADGGAASNISSLEELSLLY